MTKRERFLVATAGGVPDRVPAVPDISNYIPCKKTGLPYWDIYFFQHVPLWKAYLDAIDYYGAEAWLAYDAPFIYGDSRVQRKTHYTFDAGRDVVVRHTTCMTPDGEMTSQYVCPRYDPPSPTEKPVKDLSRDFKKLKWLLQPPTGIDMRVVEEMRKECHSRGQAYGAAIGYPGFQVWMCYVQGGVEPLAFAEMDTPEILEEWFELDCVRWTKEMELLLSVKPDFVTFGGSGTITLASPQLARKYAIPALAKLSRMAKDAGVPTNLHSCGKSRMLVDMLADETDVCCINPLEISPMGDVDLAEVKKARGKDIALMGNLHTTEVMLRGTAKQVTEKALQAMRDAGEGGGFVLSTGDQCGRETPDENIFALVNAAKEFGKYAPDGTLPKVREYFAGRAT